ncbi:hypothetical protein OIO90_005209 [Microbotryomycetes sp. JL221]|nr:hypothetical protein OIO90_005209 [Microbotryomycetes sp. JL221]
MWRLTTAVAVVTCLACSAVAAPQAASPTSSSQIQTTPNASASQPPGTSQSSLLPPFYSAPNTFEPTATGPSAIPGQPSTIVNTAGAGSVTDTFVYTPALSTVPPTGNVTMPVTGAGVTESNLQPDPANLQTAAAQPRAFASVKLTLSSSIVAVVLVGVVGGAALV